MKRFRLSIAAGLAMALHAVFLSGWRGGQVQQPFLRPITKTLAVSLSQRQIAVVRPRERQKTKKPAKVPREKEAVKPAVLPRKAEKAPRPEKKATQRVQPTEKRSGGPEKTGRTASENRVEQAAVLSARPLYHLNPPPEYPPVARRRRYQGLVLLEALVKIDGRVGDLRLLRSSGFRILDDAALKAVRNWSFEPGRRGHRRVALWVKVPVRFELR